MFAEMQVGTEESIQEMSAKYADWLKPRLKSKEYQGWFVIKDDNILAGAGVWFLDWQPSPRDTEERHAYLLNVFTEIGCRRQGLARYLVEHVLRECHKQGITRVKLHASLAGESLYRSLGFALTNEMSLKLEKKS
jgi:predicted acetyltransferase